MPVLSVQSTITGLAWRTLVACCCCSLSVGWIIGIWGGITSMPYFATQFFHHSSAAAQQATSFCLYNDQVLSLTGSVIYLSALPALAAAAHATHAYGRKPTMWAIAALIVCGAAAGAAAQHLATVFVSRALLGMAMGCSFQAPTMLLCEVLPRQKRGLGMYAYNLCMALGFLVAALANMLLHTPPWGWRLSVALLATPGVVLAVLLPSITESPQVLLQHGQQEAAVQVLYRIRLSGTNVAAELDQMAAAAAKASSLTKSSQRMRVLLSEHKPELVASVLHPLVLMMTGLNVLSTWTPNLLVALGAAPRFASWGNTVMMAAGLVAALPGMFVVERIGRRTLLATGGAVIVASLTGLAVLVANLQTDTGGTGTEAQAASNATLLPIALALLCINRVALTCTLQPLAAAVPAEVQPLQVRSATSSLTTGVRNGSSWLVTQFALPLLCTTRWGLFIIFAGCTAVGVIALWLLVPETRGLPLEQVHLAWQSHWFWGRSRHVESAADASIGSAAGSAHDVSVLPATATVFAADADEKHCRLSNGVNVKLNSTSDVEVIEVVTAITNRSAEDAASS